MKNAALVAMAISVFIAFPVGRTLAQEGKEKQPAKEKGDGHGHSHFTKIPATVEEIWKAIHKQQGKLTSVVAKKDLGEAHDHAFAIRDLVKALPAKVPAESKAQAEEGAREVTKIAANIDKSGAAGAQKATEANVKKMGDAIKTLEANLRPREPKK